MAKVKTNKDLFIEIQEWQRNILFLKDKGLLRLESFDAKNFGIVNNVRDTNFTNLRVVPGSSVTKVSIKAGCAVDKNLNILTNEIDLIDACAIPTDNVWRGLKINYNYTTFEEGTLSIAANGTMTGTGTKFTQILRGQPNFAAVIYFPNSANNTGEYEVVSVISDTLAILQGAFTVETDLQYVVVGTFTPGVVIPGSSKEIFEYDFFDVTLAPLPLSVTPGVDFVLAHVRSNGITLEIQDYRSEYLFHGAEFDLEKLSLKSLINPLVGLENIRYDTKYSDRSENLVKVGWGFKVLSADWSYSNVDDSLTITAGMGGVFKSVADFTDGDFDGWRVVFGDKFKRALVTSSYLVAGTNIKLELREFNFDNYSVSGCNITIVPDCESIKFLAVPSVLATVNHFTDGDSGTMESNITGLVINPANTSGSIAQSTVQKHTGLLSAAMSLITSGGSTAWMFKGNTTISSMTSSNLYRIIAWVWVDSIAAFNDTFLRIGVDGFATSVLTQITQWNAMTSPTGEWFKLEADLAVGSTPSGKITIEYGGTPGTALVGKVVYVDDVSIVDAYEIIKNVEEQEFLNIADGEGFLRLKSGSKNKLFWSHVLFKSNTPLQLINDGTYEYESSFNEDGVLVTASYSSVVSGIFKVILDTANFYQQKANIAIQNTFLDTQTLRYGNANYNASTYEIVLQKGNTFLVNSFTAASLVKKISSKGVGTKIHLIVQNSCQIVGTGGGGFIYAPTYPATLTLAAGDIVQLVEVQAGYWKILNVFGNTYNTLTLQTDLAAIIQVIGTYSFVTPNWQPTYTSHNYIVDTDNLIAAISKLDAAMPSPYAKIPLGGIINYSGSLSDFDSNGMGITATNMAGWALCWGITLTLPGGGTITTPDLRGLFIVGHNPLDPDYSTIGNTGGETEHTLTQAETPTHHHGINGDPGHTHDVYTNDGGGGGAYTPKTGDTSGTGHTVGAAAQTSGAHSHGGDTDSGAPSLQDLPHENRPPFYTLAMLMRIY